MVDPTDLLRSSWPGLPAGFLIAAGLAAIVHAVRRDRRAMCLPVTNPDKVLAMVRCFRTSIIGLAMMAVGAAWCWELGDLLGLALIIGIGETLETTAVLAAIRTNRRASLKRISYPRFNWIYPVRGSA